MFSGSNPNGSRTKILVIGDHPVTRDTVSKALKASDFEVMEASTEEGTQLLQDRPNLIVLAAHPTQSMDPEALVATVKNLIQANQSEPKLMETVQTFEEKRMLSDQFVSTLTHDLRNPLTAAKVSAQVLGRIAYDPAKQATLVARIIDNLNRANQMIDRLLDTHSTHAGGSHSIEIEEALLK